MNRNFSNEDLIEKIGLVQSTINQVVDFLTPLLPLLNAHNADFYTNDHWNHYVPDNLKDELLNTCPKDFHILVADESKFISGGNLSTFLTSCTNNGLKLIDNLNKSLSEVLLKYNNGVMPVNEISISNSMDSKKFHEIQQMAWVIGVICQSLSIETVIDVGSGRGYLGAMIAFKYGYHVLGLESTDLTTHSARERFRKLNKHWDGLTQKSGPTSWAIRTSNRAKRLELYKPITEYVNHNTDLHKLLSKNFSFNTDSCDRSFALTGLHACGDLSSDLLRLFIKSDSQCRLLCLVGCCYQHLTEQDYCKPDSDENVSSEHGFPLSSFLKLTILSLGRNARMLASQSICRNTEFQLDPSESLHWRATLQVILTEITGEKRDDWIVGRLSSQCSSFIDYVKKSLLKLNIKKEIPDALLNDYEEKYRKRKPQLFAFYQLKVWLAPVIESLILLDRLCFLLEQNNMEDVHLLRLFDPIISPRCYALIAVKKP